MRALVILLLFCSHITLAQIDLPDLSPRSSVVQEVGYTRIEVYYGRPSARGRKMLGGNNPYGKLWRTGGGKSTWLIFDTEVFIADKKVPAGAYALVTIPGEKEWTVMLSTDTATIYGDPSEYDVKEEAVKLTVNPEKTDRFYESLTMYLDSKKYDAEFYLAWENTQIHFPIVTRSHQKALTAIDEALKKNTTDHRLFAEAAYYYSMNDESPDQILRWLDTSLSIEEDRWVYTMKIDILEKVKKYPEARETAAKAISYLKRTKIAEWEMSVAMVEKRVNSWPR